MQCLNNVCTVLTFITLNLASVLLKVRVMTLPYTNSSKPHDIYLEYIIYICVKGQHYSCKNCIAMEQ